MFNAGSPTNRKLVDLSPAGRALCWTVAVVWTSKADTMIWFYESQWFWDGPLVLDLRRGCRGLRTNRKAGQQVPRAKGTWETLFSCLVIAYDIFVFVFCSELLFWSLSICLCGSIWLSIYSNPSSPNLGCVSASGARETFCQTNWILNDAFFDWRRARSFLDCRTLRYLISYNSTKPGCSLLSSCNIISSLSTSLTITSVISFSFPVSVRYFRFVRLTIVVSVIVCDMSVWLIVFPYIFNNDRYTTHTNICIPRIHISLRLTQLSYEKKVSEKQTIRFGCSVERFSFWRCTPSGPVDRVRKENVIDKLSFQDDKSSLLSAQVHDQSKIVILMLLTGPQTWSTSWFDQQTPYYPPVQVLNTLLERFKSERSSLDNLWNVRVKKVAGDKVQLDVVMRHRTGASSQRCCASLNWCPRFLFHINSLP